jgi:SAM-dependent methyltransferase
MIGMESSARASGAVSDASALRLSCAAWRAKASFFHREDSAYLRFLVPKGRRALEPGCSAGHTLAALEPVRGVGVDRASEPIDEGRASFPQLELIAGDIEDDTTLAGIDGKFDAILLVDTIGYLRDCQALLENLHQFCARETRLIVVYYSHLWDPLLRLAETIGWKRRDDAKNVLSPEDIAALAALADFEVVKSERRLLCPLRLLGIGRFINRFFS